MTDGPFKNLKLGSCWKRFAEAVQNNAVSPTECGPLASDALVRHLTTVENCSALKTLEAYGRGQLDLDPLASVEAIFDACEKTPLLDKLKNELQFRMANGSSSLEALPQARKATIEDQICKARDRLEAEFISLRDTDEMSQEACQQALDKVYAAFDGVDRQGIDDALRAGDRNAFKEAASKKDDLEEGPRL